MGYTHYLHQKSGFTRDEWTQVKADIAAILYTAIRDGVAIADGEGERGQTESLPDVFSTDGKALAFNGLGPDMLETFLLTQARPAQEPWQDRQSRGSYFCKTGRKAYDSAVAAVCCYLDSCYANRITTGADGNLEDYAAGLALARKALPRLGNVLNIPEAIRFDALIKAAPIAGRTFVVAEFVDGSIKVYRRATLSIAANFPAGPVADEFLPVLRAMKDKLPRTGYVHAIDRANDNAARRIIDSAWMWGGTDTAS